MIPKRFARLRSILDRRQDDLTILMDNVHKPHNVSAVLRTCDAVGILEMHAVSPDPKFVARHVSAGGSSRWVKIHTHPEHRDAHEILKQRDHQILAAHLSPRAIDFRQVDYTRPTAILLGSERDGPGAEALAIIDQAITIPMHGAVESLNVSVAAAIILFEAQRQRAAAGLYDQPRLDPERKQTLLFEWAYPRLAEFCQRKNLPYPRLGPEGEILDPLPRG